MMVHFAGAGPVDSALDFQSMSTDYVPGVNIIPSARFTARQLGHGFAGAGMS